MGYVCVSIHSECVRKVVLDVVVITEKNNTVKLHGINHESRPYRSVSEM